MGFLYRSTTTFTGPGAAQLPVVSPGSTPTTPGTPPPVTPTEPAYPISAVSRRFDANTLSLTAGSTVTSWADSSGSGQALTATKGTPVFQTVDGVKAVVLQSTIMEQALSLPQPHTLSLAFKLNTLPPGNAVISGAMVTAGTDNATLQMNNFGEVYANAGTSWKAKTGVTAGWYRVIVVFNGANSSVTWNGTTVTGDTGTLPRAQFSLGGHRGGSFTDISVSHATVIPRALSTSEVASVDEWLKRRAA